MWCDMTHNMWRDMSHDMWRDMSHHMWLTLSWKLVKMWLPWHAKWNDLSVGMWHEYMTCDMDTWHVTWMHNMCHGYMTCDMDTWLLTEQLCWLKLSNYLERLEIYLYIRNIWVSRYFTLHDLCHDLWDLIWHGYTNYTYTWNDTSCE